MKKFAVAYFTYFDDKLKVEIVEAFNWRQAIACHSEIAKYVGKSDEDLMPPEEETHDLESMKRYFFNGDSMIDVVEVK